MISIDVINYNVIQILNDDKRYKRDRFMIINVVCITAIVVNYVVTQNKHRM